MAKLNTLWLDYITAKIVEVIAAEFKTLWFDFIVTKLERRTWPNWRLSNSASSWMNQRSHRGQIEDSPSPLCHGRIGEVITAKSKTLWLSFVMAESERSLCLNWGLSSSASSPVKLNKANSTTVTTKWWNWLSSPSKLIVAKLKRQADYTFSHLIIIHIIVPEACS